MLHLFQQPDSTAVALGSAISGFLVLKLAAAYGVVNKFLTDITSKLGNKLTSFESKLSPTMSGFVTAALAYVGSTGIAFLNSEVTKFGIPAASDVAHLNVFLMGGFATLLSMGAHSFLTKVVNMPNIADLVANLFKSTPPAAPATPATPATTATPTASK